MPPLYLASCVYEHSKQAHKYKNQSLRQSLQIRGKKKRKKEGKKEKAPAQFLMPFSGCYSWPLGRNGFSQRGLVMLNTDPPCLRLYFHHHKYRAALKNFIPPFALDE